jgi:hypothetical protein
MRKFLKIGILEIRRRMNQRYKGRKIDIFLLLNSHTLYRFWLVYFFQCLLISRCTVLIVRINLILWSNWKLARKIRHLWQLWRLIFCKKKSEEKPVHDSLATFFSCSFVKLILELKDHWCPILSNQSNEFVNIHCYLEYVKNCQKKVLCYLTFCNPPFFFF